MESIKIEVVIGIIMLLINVGAIIWGFAKVMTKLEMKPSREEVQQMIDAKIDDHCPYAIDINHFKSFMEDRVLLLEELKRIRVAGQLLNISKMDDSARRSQPDDAAKKADKSKKRMGSTSRRAKPKAAE